MSDTRTARAGVAEKVKRLQKGGWFDIETETERTAVYECTRVLRDASVIDFEIVTKASADGFRVYRVG